jgi:hypothetical protein
MSDHTASNEQEDCAAYEGDSQCLLDSFHLTFISKRVLSVGLFLAVVVGNLDSNSRKCRLQVIYHLNNKNEDHDFDLQEQGDQYESEIEQVGFLCVTLVVQIVTMCSMCPIL